LLLDKTKFPASFAGDVSAEKAAFMADSQVPWGVNALGGTVSEPAWKAKPNWYLLTTEGRDGIVLKVGNPENTCSANSIRSTY